MTNFLTFPQEVEKYLSILEDSHQAQWGTMTAQHMVEHLLLVLNLSMAKFKQPIEVQTPTEKLPKYKAALMSDFPFPREFKAPILPKDSLLPLRYPNLAQAKESLMLGIAAFFDYYQQNPTATNVHPVFGECNFEEWVHFHRKHFTHHFEQFALLGEK